MSLRLLPAVLVLGAAIVAVAVPAGYAQDAGATRVHIGTSMFDQWRSMSRTHTFDLNAASEVDLVAVAGVDRRLAGAIPKAGPYRTVGELQRVPGMTRPLLEHFAALVGPAVGFGVPAALYSFSFPSRLRRRLAAARPGGGVPGRARLACVLLVAWGLAAAPLALLITPLF